MKKFVPYFVLAAAGLLAACGLLEPRVDTSSPQAFQASLQRIDTKLPADEREDFQQGLVAVALEGQEYTPFAVAMVGSQIFLSSPGARRIRGRTGPEIVRLGLRQRIDSLASRINEDARAIQQADIERQRHASVFNAIQITNTRYRYDTSLIGEPVLSFDIANTSTTPIRSVDMQATLRSAGRTIPWVDAPLSYEFPGGLEPGERRHLDLTTYRDGWSGQDFRDRTDLQLSLQVQNLQTADGVNLISADMSSIGQRRASMAEAANQKRQLEQRLAALH